MNIISLYYYASVPILTCNLLFYSITMLSTSITSSQNVVKFISEHKDADNIVFKNEIETMDLVDRLRIIEALIYDIIKKKCITDDEYIDVCNALKTSNIMCEKQDEENQFDIIEFDKKPLIMLDRICTPIRYALISTIEMVNKINDILIVIHNKITTYNKSYFNVSALCLKHELSELTKKVDLLDSRFQLLIQLLPLYIQ